jgi:hypothetical protein
VRLIVPESIDYLMLKSQKGKCQKLRLSYWDAMENAYHHL